MEKAISPLIVGAAVLAVLSVPLISFAVGPTLILSTSSGAPGSTVQVSGSQFGASTNVLVSLAGTSTGATVTNSSFNTFLTVPNVQSGTYTVLATSPQREQASANFFIQNNSQILYYPNAQPSSWYLLPGQQLRFTGSGFAPGATVSVQGGGGTLTAVADGTGSFATQFVTVPYKWQSSRQQFVVSSSNTAYNILMTLTIGTFYPNMQPSSYYVALGQGMSASVSGFAQGEPVMLLVNGALVVQKTADNSGSAAFDFTAPTSGSTFMLTAEGAFSHVIVSRTITLH